MLLRFLLLFGSGWHMPTLQLLATWVQFRWFLADQYAHHLPNCLSPVQKHLCHLNTALRPKVFLLYACLIIWNFSLADLTNFWRNMTFSHCSNCNILNFANRRQLPFTTVTFWIHTCTELLLLEREKNGHGGISWLHISGAVHNSTTMRPSHEITDCTTYVLI
jgi:hypothetical protein